jgi:uncharacterized protein
VIVTRLASSTIALRALVALGQAPDGRRVADLAAILGVPFTSIERALAILGEDGLIDRRERRYSVVESARTRAATQFAIAFVAPAELLAAVTRANRAVEFCGQDERGAVVVVRRFADLLDEAALARFVEAFRSVTNVSVDVVQKSALRDRLAVDDAPRMRAQQMRILAGSLDRTFPDPRRRGDPAALPLGALHPTLKVPSERRLRDLARRYHLRRIAAFGSATREDFRPDSDIDLVVEMREGHRPRLGEAVRLMSEVEDLFGRDVDVLTGPIARPDLRARIERDAVVLYDAAR